MGLPVTDGGECMKNLDIKKTILIALLILALVGMIIVWPFRADIYKNAAALQDQAGSKGIKLFEAMRSPNLAPSNTSVGGFIARLVALCAFFVIFVACVVMLKKIRYFLLAIGALIMVFPFYWMIASAFKTTGEIKKFPPDMLPGSWSNFANYRSAWTYNDSKIAHSFLNSILVCTSSVALVTFTTILAAFAFSHLKFPGRDLLFTLLLSMMMVPFELLIITNRQTIISLGLNDKLLGLVVPFTSSIFYTYILRNFFASVPESLYQSSQVDGSSNWQYLWKVMVPIARPSLVTIVLLNAMASWNSFMWPQVVINNTINTKSTLPLALSMIGDEVDRADNIIMAGATITVLPMLVLFLFARKQIVRGVARGGIKG